MKKSDLKTGMIVTLRNGYKLMVFLNANTGSIKESDVLVNLNGVNWSDLNGFHEDLTCKFGVEFDIVMVEKVKTTVDLIYKIIHHSSDRTEIIWERKEKKKYTYAQIKNILGEEFEVVEKVTPQVQMTKSDLKTGMIITVKSGHKFMVYKDMNTAFGLGDVVVDIKGNDSWNYLSSYNENLTHMSHPNADIVKVEKVTHPYAFIRLGYEADKREVLWERKKKYTYDQLKDKLGEEFEIVKEN